MSTCLNKGCGKLVSDPSDCEYHSGAPIFHEGLKGWSCCSKRVTDFDEFLKIPGCTTGKHSDVPPAVEPTPKASVQVPDTPQPTPQHTPTVPVVDVVENPEPEIPKLDELSLNDHEDAVIPDGTICKRKGCGVASPNSNECVFHSGTPIFHEGSKGWSCCSRKVLEFDEFLKIPGCATGKHRFTEPARSVDCRRDWYQTPDSVILSIFAKKVNKSKTTIDIQEKTLSVHILFMDGTFSDINLSLFQPIQVDKSNFEILSTKIEITLKKSNGLGKYLLMIAWPSLEPTNNITTWTTFGTTGTVGTVGAKDAVVASDAPVQWLK